MSEIAVEKKSLGVERLQFFFLPVYHVRSHCVFMCVWVWVCLLQVRISHSVELVGALFSSVVKWIDTCKPNKCRETCLSSFLQIFISRSIASPKVFLMDRIALY